MYLVLSDSVDFKAPQEDIKWIELHHIVDGCTSSKKKTVHISVSIVLEWHQVVISFTGIVIMLSLKTISVVFSVAIIIMSVLFFSCDQAALWMVQSVCPSVCLSVRPSVRLSVTPFWLCSHHPIIMKFSGVITSDKSDVHAKGQGQRSKVKVTEVTTQIFVSGL